MLLFGCQSTPQSEQLRKATLSGVNTQHFISEVPFYPQQDFYCGPTTLSEVFNFYGQNKTPSEIAPKLFIPKKEGSLQLEMITATRQYDFLPYSDTGTLENLIRLLDDDIPVIVFQNLSIAWLPQWHYALVIGYDQNSGEFLLHTGVTANHRMSFELFEKTWARGEYWYLAPLPLDTKSNALDPFIYVQAAFDMLKVGKAERAVAYLKAATTNWPYQWLAYFLLANHYLDQEPELAVTWFEKGFHVGKSQAPYLNNFATALMQAGCKEAALKTINQATGLFPKLKYLQDTQSEINNHADVATRQCPLAQ